MFLASAYLAGIPTDGGIAAPALLRCRGGDGKRVRRQRCMLHIELTRPRGRGGCAITQTHRQSVRLTDAARVSDAERARKATIGRLTRTSRACVLQLAILISPLKANALAELPLKNWRLYAFVLRFHATIRSRGESRFHWLRRSANLSSDFVRVRIRAT